MTDIEARLRSALRTEADAVATARGTPRVTLDPRLPVGGGWIAAASAVAVLVVVGGVALLTRGDGDVAGDQGVTPSTTPFEAVPFAGDTWQFTVGEGANPSGGTYKVCYRFDPVGEATEASGLGPSGCGDWPSDAPGYLIGVDQAIWTDSGVVLLVDLTANPVDHVTVAGDGVHVTLTPFTLPGSGKQFAVLEVPQVAEAVSVEAFDAASASLGRVGDVEVSSATRVAKTWGGEPLTNDELEAITGSTFTHSGYLVASTTTADGAYELGLMVYQERLPDEGSPWTCFTPIAVTQGINVAGGGICADDPGDAARLADFDLSMGESCGPIPKEAPVVDGIRRIFALWGVPDGAETVKVGLGDGTTIEVEVRNGVALHLWEESVDVISVDFDGMTDVQRERVSSYLPAPSVGADCASGDIRGG